MRRRRSRPTWSAGSSGPLSAFHPSAPPPKPLADSLAVFRRPRRDEDKVPAALAPQAWFSDEPEPSPQSGEDLPELPEPFMYRLPLPGRARRRERLRQSFVRLHQVRLQRRRLMGSAVPAESRLLVGPVGRRGYRLVAIPTTTGMVTFYALPSDDAGGGGGTFTLALDDGFTWHASWHTDSDGVVELVVYGLVADDVDAVRVEIGRERHDAVVGENGYILAITECDPDDLTAFCIRRRDGRTARFERPGA